MASNPTVHGYSPGISAPAPPCDRCDLSRRCKVQQLACEAFGLYLNGARERVWSAAPRLPSRALYLRSLNAAAR